MTQYKILNCDVLAGLAKLPDESVQTCITSPLYFGLRDYGTDKWSGGNEHCGHKKTALVGKASTLRSGGRKHTGPYSDEKAASFSVTPYKDVCAKCGARRIDNQIGLEKSPDAYVAKLVEVFREVRRVLKDDGCVWLNLGDSYNAAGRASHGTRIGYKQATNRASATKSDSVRPSDYLLKPKDLIGIPWRVVFALQADGWWLRSDIIWAKPNPMPESVTDRPTKAHEYVFLLSKNAKYFYDADAVKENAVQPRGIARETGQIKSVVLGHSGGKLGANYGSEYRNRRSVWTITPKPFKDAHFAVMPEALVEPCILAGSKEGDTVLDPFAGSGTVGVVALRRGRQFIGCELNAEYAAMARRRIEASRQKSLAAAA